jgi:hypothetical protein
VRLTQRHVLEHEARRRAHKTAGELRRDLWLVPLAELPQTIQAHQKALERSKGE